MAINKEKELNLFMAIVWYVAILVFALVGIGGLGWIILEVIPSGIYGALVIAGIMASTLIVMIFYAIGVAVKQLMRALGI